MNNYISTAIILIVTFCFFKNTNAEVEGPQFRVIGGLSTRPREIKYLVGIYRNDNYICGGGIIGQKYILTAAHCVVNSTDNELKTGRFKIVAGSDNLNVKTPSTVEIGVKKFYVPKVYNGSLWDGRFPIGDVAVLELKNKLDLTHNRKLQKLELPSQEVKLAPHDGVYKNFPTQTAGFGMDNFTYYTDYRGKKEMKWEASRKLLKAKVQILDRSVCQKAYRFLVGDKILCGRVQNYLDRTYQGICKGDSGSPLVQNGTTVIGVISGSSKYCNDNRWPGVYTKIASYKKFIRNAKQGITDDMRIQVL